MNLATVFDRHPDDAVAFISRGRNTTYGELSAQVAGYRAGLAELGLEPGDRLAIICGNNWYFVASYLAALGAGLVAVPLNPISPPLELSAQLNAVGARGVVIGPKTLRRSNDKPRGRRRLVFADHWDEMAQCLEEHPDQTAVELLVEFQARYPGRYSLRQLYTLQKRVRLWRQQAVQRLIRDVSGNILGEATGNKVT